MHVPAEQRNLEEKLTLLRRAHHALPDGGALVVYDTVIDDDRRENTFGLLMSLNMLIETQDGFDYTGADCRSWMPTWASVTATSSTTSVPTPWSLASNSH